MKRLFRLLPLAVTVGHIGVCIYIHCAAQMALARIPGIGVIRAYQCAIAINKECQKDPTLVKKLKGNGVTIMEEDSSSLIPNQYFHDAVQMTQVHVMGEPGKLMVICTNPRGSVILFPDGTWEYTYEGA